MKHEQWTDLTDALLCKPEIGETYTAESIDAKSIGEGGNDVAICC
jgi:hypothetical protein